MKLADPPVADRLAAALLRAVQAQDFATTPDAWQGGAAVGVHPSIDLAVVAFPPPGAASGAPVAANVLFSREHPGGVIARIPADGGVLANIRFDQDQRDARNASILWAPGANWTQQRFTPLWPEAAALQADPGPRLRFVAPYPASLLKLMVAVGVGLAVDRGELAWPDELEPMITVSSNEATDACVALLHRAGWLRTQGVSPLNEVFARRGLPTLQLHGTTAAGGWRNPDGAGVGRIHMTAWDTVRLLWLIDAAAPPPPWLPAGTPPLLQPATRERLRAVLERQELDEMLSSGKHRALPGWVPGLPDAPRFAHKTGTTDNYGSDAGIVRADAAGRGHLLVAALTTLGLRYAPHKDLATTWRLPALGAAVMAATEALWEPLARPAVGD
jgi:beta-lactamase class A